MTVLEPQYSIRNERYKLIESLRGGGIECFDLLTDPGENHDVCNAVPAVAAELKASLDAHLQDMVAKAKSFPDWKITRAWPSSSSGTQGLCRRWLPMS